MRTNNKPTRGTPLTTEELAFKASKGWVGGARFEKTSTFGSHSSNSGTRKKKKSKPTAVPARLTIIPRWAKKYL